MSSFAKFIGASLGWSFGGPIGGILGFALGSLIDGFSQTDLKSGSYSKRGATATGDFEISLLILAAVVIKSDGKVNQRELDFVRSNFISMYGKVKADNAFKLFNGIMKEKISTRQVCVQIRQHMSHASRLQLLHFLFGIAKADGAVSYVELQVIKKISVYLYISNRDFESIRAMFSTSSSRSNGSNNYTSSTAYKILEITKKATNTEVKKAYRKLVKKHHPDKLRHLGEEYQKGAEEKFRQIQKAYEQIQKERGM
ncbi:MAG TPA: molecular chaperone DjlA [Flavobacteriaceae bacterium]|jgi:DnaJ like chaperone protein|nr:molecular chaperone DjlA [Flavobacteriaceae bacterium]HBS12259.1 molecular chaperone DjlA [Flavobacteriaceae bacterium]